MQIAMNTRINLHFELSLADGSIVDSTFNRAPAEFEFGDGQLPDGFQSYLIGMSEGQCESYSIPPEKAFGMPNPNNLQTMKRKDFSEDIALAEGLVVSFADANQSELPGVIKSFDELEVVVDFNHPLAGEVLNFKVEIVAVAAI